MVTALAERTKDKRIVLRCESDFLERVNRVAKSHFAENRSYMVRLALEELIDRKERETEEGRAA